MLYFVIFCIGNWLEKMPRVLVFDPKVENTSPLGILLRVPATADFHMEYSSVDWKVRLSDWYFVLIRIIEPESNPTRRHEDKGFGIREVDGILLPGGC